MMIDDQVIFPLVSTALDWLRPGGGERFELHPAGADAVSASLSIMLATGLPARPSLEPLLRLSATLEADSPSAARTLLKIISSSPGARRALGLVDADDERRRARRCTGDDPVEFKAPRIDTPPPKGTVRTRDLVPVTTLTDRPRLARNAKR